MDIIDNFYRAGDELLALCESEQCDIVINAAEKEEKGGVNVKVMPVAEDDKAIGASNETKTSCKCDDSFHAFAVAGSGYDDAEKTEKQDNNNNKLAAQVSDAGEELTTTITTTTNSDALSQAMNDAPGKTGRNAPV